MGISDSNLQKRCCIINFNLTGVKPAKNRQNYPCNVLIFFVFYVIFTAFSLIFNHYRHFSLSHVNARQRVFSLLRLISWDTELSDRPISLTISQIVLFYASPLLILFHYWHLIHLYCRFSIRMILSTHPIHLILEHKKIY